MYKFLKVIGVTAAIALFSTACIEFPVTKNISIEQNDTNTVMIANHVIKPNTQTKEMDSGSALGAGVLIDSTHVITVRHLLDDDSTIPPDIIIKTKDGKMFHATVVDTDKPNDIMILKLDTPVSVGVTTVFTCSKPSELGREIYSIGQPNGFERFISFGWISVIQIPDDDSHPHIPQWIANFPLFHGNSGGATFDKATGVIVGLADAIFYWTDEFGNHPAPVSLMVDPATMCAIMTKNKIGFKESK